jgi:nucleotide-binding universal stress UspA family protein
MRPEQLQVVVGFNFSASSEVALRRAVAIVVRAPFHVLNVACILDPHGGVHAVPAKQVDITYADEVRDRVAAIVAQELREAHANAVHFNVHVRIARHPDKELLDIAKEIGADLIIVGSRERTALERLFAGSVSEHVVRDAGCAVVVARDKGYADVELDEIIEVEPHAHAHAAHRYSYDDQRATLRPSDWPIY